MEPGIEISALCRREGILPTQYYQWKNQLVSSADSVFGERGQGKAEEREQARHDQVLRRKDAVIAEITAENLELKKTLSD
jgi:transposase-like protein